MQNIRTYCIPLGEVKSDDVVTRGAEPTPIFMGVEDSASFATGHYYDLSDIDSWVEFTLPPVPGAGLYDIPEFKTGGGDRFPVAWYGAGLAGGVAPPEGKQVFFPRVNLPDLPAVGAGGFAYGPNYAIFVRISGAGVYPTYEPPMFGDNEFSLSVGFSAEWHNFEAFFSGSFYADPGTDMKFLLAIGFAPVKQVGAPPFWTGFRRCREMP